MRLRIVGFGACLAYICIGSATGDEALSIYEAALEGDTQRVTLLLEEGAEVNASNDVGTPLMWALFAGQSEVVKLLLASGADPNVEGASGTPLKMAVVNGSIEVVRELLEHGARPNEGERSTPLTAAAGRGSLEIVKLLLAHGADAGVATFEGNTALHEAVRGGDLKIAQDAGRSRSQRQRNHCDWKATTPPRSCRQPC